MILRACLNLSEWSKLHYFLFRSALESPTIRSSPSLYEGAFRLETASSPGSLFSSVHPGLMFNSSDCKPDITDQDESPMSSPIDESYKIRIGPRGSLSPRSHDDDDQSKHEDSEAQDLSISAQNQSSNEVAGHPMDFCKSGGEESAEEMMGQSEGSAPSDDIH